MRSKLEESVPFFAVAVVTAIMSSFGFEAGLSIESHRALFILIGVGAASCSLVCVAVLLRIWLGHSRFWDAR